MRAAHAGSLREQQQPFARLVEPADGREPRQAGAVEAAIDRVAAVLVARGGHQAARLVEHEVDAAFGARRGHGRRRAMRWRPAIVGNSGSRTMRPSTRTRPGANPFGGLRARTHAALGERACESVSGCRGLGQRWRRLRRASSAARPAMSSSALRAGRRASGAAVGASSPASCAAGAAVGGAGAVRQPRAPPPFATRTPRAFIHWSNSSAVMRLPFWFMSNRHGVLSNCVFGL